MDIDMDMDMNGHKWTPPFSFLFFSSSVTADAKSSYVQSIHTRDHGATGVRTAFILAHAEYAEYAEYRYKTNMHCTTASCMGCGFWTSVSFLSLRDMYSVCMCGGQV